MSAAEDRLAELEARVTELEARVVGRRGSPAIVRQKCGAALEQHSTSPSETDRAAARRIARRMGLLVREPRR